jgi:5-methylcytosine-specific restriction endonuclease McrA
MGEMAYDRRYRANRFVALERARWRCQIRGPECHGWATQVDHVIPVAMGGTNDLANLRAACAQCNPRGGLMVVIAKQQARAAALRRRSQA